MRRRDADTCPFIKLLCVCWSNVFGHKNLPNIHRYVLCEPFRTIVLSFCKSTRMEPAGNAPKQLTIPSWSRRIWSRFLGVDSTRTRRLGEAFLPCVFPRSSSGTGSPYREESSTTSWSRVARTIGCPGRRLSFHLPLHPLRLPPGWASWWLMALTLSCRS
jgi:hypothetical protein